MSKSLAWCAGLYECAALKGCTPYMQVVRWCKEKEIGLVLVGPEAPLVAGLVDSLKQNGIRSVLFFMYPAAILF